MAELVRLCSFLTCASAGNSLHDGHAADVTCAPHCRPCTPPQPQDFLNRCNLPMEEMARSLPPTVCMLCLHGTADTTIPYAVRAGGLSAKVAMGVVDCKQRPHAGQAALHAFGHSNSPMQLVCRQLSPSFCPYP